jgi:peptidoglycan/LPS O-acetylase OafA/YrhL
MWQYGLNRFLRIVPALLVWAVAVLMLDVLTGYYAPNGSLWTIPAECSFYVAVPVVLWRTHRFGWSRTLPLLIAVTMLGIALGLSYDVTSSGRLFLSLYTFVPWALFFVVGMLWLRYEGRIPLRTKWALIALVAYILLRSADVFGLQANVGDQAIQYAGALPLAYLIFFVGYRGPAFLAAIPRRIGDLSYGTYIWHMFVIDVILHFGWGWPAWTVLPATLVLAAASWWLVEGPSLRMKHYSSRSVPLPADASKVSTTEPRR